MTHYLFILSAAAPAGPRTRRADCVHDSFQTLSSRSGGGAAQPAQEGPARPTDGGLMHGPFNMGPAVAAAKSGPPGAVGVDRRSGG